MARILIAAMPGVGHVTPLLPVAEELVRRGHDVRFYTGHTYRAKVERTGATYEPMRTPVDPGDDAVEDHVPEMRDHEGLGALKRALKYFFIDSGVGQVADLRRLHAEWPIDIVVNDAAFIGAGWFHELGGPIWAAVSPVPLMLSSRDVPPFGPAFPYLAGRLGRARNAALQQLVQHVLMRDVVGHADRVRASIGLPARHEMIFDGTLSPYLFLQSGVPSMEYPRSDLPPQLHFVGSMQRAVVDAGFAAPTWWDEVVTGDRPVVHVTQGTVSTDAAMLLRPTLAALAEQDVLVVATTGGPDPATLGPLPVNARAAAFIPHGNLLPHVSAMVTNGGFGGVQTALAHRVPLVVAGSTEEKPEVARRVAFSGAGLDLRTGHPSADRLRAAVRRLLDDPSFRQRSRLIGDEFAAHDAPVESARLVEQLLDTRRPVRRAEAVGA